MTRIQQKKAFKVVLISVILLAFGCSISFAGTIKVGAVLPLTGWGAAEGTYVLNGAKLAVEKINAAGGIKGNKLELIAEDGKNDPTESLNAAQKLVTRDKVSVMMGAWLSTATLAMIPIINRNQVPLVVETSGYDGITHPLNKWVFRTSILFSQEAASVAPCLSELGFKNVVFMAQDNDWGRGTVAEFTKVIEASGGRVVKAEFLDSSTMDFYPQLTKLRGSEADSIIVVNSTGPAAKLLQQHKELGLTQKIMTTGGSTWTYTISRLAGAEAAEGSYHLSFFPAFAPEATPNPDQAKAYTAAWKKAEFSWDGVQEGSRGWDAIFTIAEGIKMANGSSKRKAIREGLEKIDMKGITGHIKFDEFHDQNPNIVVVKIEGGESKVVECK
ncbi:MAG: ABC transporter substrate-binding protein [Deltaproteobacteria bacterium]|nr:MAG: ABC transporter substrate-binding protein [Deltaproteobacteria bacterium]